MNTNFWQLFFELKSLINNKPFDRKKWEENPPRLIRYQMLMSICSCLGINLKSYIERMGTGTADMIRIAEENNLKEPLFEQNEDFQQYYTDQVQIIAPLSTHQVPRKYRRSFVVLP